MGRKVDWSTIPDDDDASRDAEPAQAVIVSDGCLTVRDWQTRDEDIVTFFEGSNLEILLQRALKVGVLALRSAHVSVGVDVVQREFERLTARLDTSLDARIRELNADLQAVFDPNRGAMSVTLKRYLDQGGTLADFFDLNRRDSATSRFRDLLSEHVGGEGSKLYRLLDASNGDSPLSKLRADLHAELRDLRGLIENYRKEIAERYSAETARVAERERGTLKGRDYEDLVFLAINDVAAVFGDVAMRAGDQPGIGGSKAGDIVVTLNSVDARGGAVNLTVEAKDRAVGLTAIQRELDEAQKNRGASEAIAVYSQAEYMPAGMAPFRELNGSAIICLYDKATPTDTVALQVAYRLARSRALSELHHREIEVDMQGIHEDIAAARIQVKSITSMKERLTAVRSALDSGALQLERELESLRDQMNRILDLINDRIRVRA